MATTPPPRPTDLPGSDLDLREAGGEGAAAHDLAPGDGAADEVLELVFDEPQPGGAQPLEGVAASGDAASSTQPTDELATSGSEAASEASIAVEAEPVDLAVAAEGASSTAIAPTAAAPEPPRRPPPAPPRTLAPMPPPPPGLRAAAPAPPAPRAVSAAAPAEPAAPEDLPASAPAVSAEEVRAPRDAQNVRIAALRAEHDADPDPLRRAVLRYEVGHLVERRGGEDAAVVDEYRGALASVAAFRPPLFALTRIAERRRALHLLGPLYEAEAEAAASPAEKASALLDEAVRLGARPGEESRARALFGQVLALEPGSLAASLAFERLLYAAGDADAAAGVAAARAAHVADPVLRGTLLAETAWTREAAGDVDGALAALREASALPAGRWRALWQWAQIARRHGRAAALVEALEARAVLAGAAARGENHGQGSGLFSVQRFDDAERADAEAAALWREAGRIRALALGDGAGASQAYAQALALRPDAPLLRHERMLACELAGDVEGAAAEARALLGAAGVGRHAAALHFRIAELALAQGDRAGARAALDAALAVDPRGAASAAILDDLAADDGLHAERLARLEVEALAASSPPEVRADAALRAAQLAADELGDATRARALYTLASSLVAEPITILREAHGAALRLGDASGALESGAALLALSLEAAERSALLRERVSLLRATEGGAAELDALLTGVVAEPAESHWAPDAARVHAASTGNRALLAAAHEALAAGAEDDESAAAHLAAAGRARVALGDETGALRALRAALGRVPGSRYAVALLEALHRSRGEAEEIVALLREAAAAQQGDRAAEMALLLAGAAAEAAGDAALACRTYAEVAERAGATSSPWHALARLAAKTADAAALRRAREGLAAAEAVDGPASRAALALAEDIAFLDRDTPRASALLRGVLADPEVGALAAATLATAPDAFGDAALQELALERLSRAAASAPALARERGGLALVSGTADAASRAAAHAADVLAHDPEDRWALLAAFRAAGPGSARAEALSGLASATSDADAAFEFELAALRARLLHEGGRAIDDCLLAASALADVAPDSLAAAVALDDTTTTTDDAEVRVRALSARVAHAGVAAHPALTAALGRAQLVSGQAAEAWETLTAALRADPDDLASLEAMRVAAREAEHWEDVVGACDRLAEVVRPEFAAELLEEAAAVLMDRLPDRDEDAVARLRRALAAGGMARPIAYGRLHDLLAERGDAASLEALVESRIDTVDDDAELVRLFYELARIRRSRGDLDGAVAALENLLMLEGEHVGGLALMVETTVSLERYADAVEALRALAQADVPTAQRRIARLGAADFLEAKLGDAEGALAELRAAAAAGLADAALYGKMADIAERAGRFEDAADALDRAADLASGAARAAFVRRAALICRDQLANPAGAALTLGRALEAVPTDVAAGDMLAALLDDGARQGLSERFEAAVRGELRADPTDPVVLRKLRRAAVWRRDVVLERTVLALLAALGEATADERNLLLSLPGPATRRPTSALADASFGRLRGTDGLATAAGGLTPLLALVGETLVEADRLEPARYGVGRGERVGPKDPSPVRDELLALVKAFGVSVGDLYVGGRDPGLIAAIPREGEAPIWILGAGVGVPLSPSARQRVGRLAFALRLGVAPLLARDVDEWPRFALGLAAAAGAPLAAGAGVRGVDEAAALLGKAVSRRVRKAIPDATRGLDARPEALLAGARNLARGLARAGLILAADPAPALDAALPAGVSRAAAQGSEHARDLVDFWTSLDALAMRRELGLT